MYLLGIDLGTSSIKALVLDADSVRVVASAACEISIRTPQPAWAEQSSAAWWDATIQAVREATAEIDPSGIGAVGLSGQMHGTVCVDGAGEAVRPAIIWADARSVPQLQRLLERVDPAEMAAHAPGWPDAGYMALTLMWLQEHEPETLARTMYALLPKDALRLRLTGVPLSEPTDAAASWLFDIERGVWSEWLIEQCGVEERLLPPLVSSWEVAGTLTGQAADALGLTAGIPIAAGAADMAAHALGHGLIDPDVVLAIIGTGGQVFHAMDAPRRDPEMRTTTYPHAAPGRWYAQAAILAGGLCLRWLRDTLGLARRPDAYRHLSMLAAQAPPGAEGLTFVPHLAGARRMQGGSMASGAFVGLRLHHGPGHLARAVMEGVTYAMAECLAAALSVSGQEAQVMISGGATASPLWRQIQADLYGTPVRVAEGNNHACIGAALLAGVAAGLYSSIDEAVSFLPAPALIIPPNPSSAAFYRENYARYREIVARVNDPYDE